MVFGADLNNLNRGGIGNAPGNNNNNGEDGGGGGGGGEESDNVASRIQALRAASCIRVLGKGVIRVVKRVDDAKENNKLGKRRNSSRR